MEYTCSDLSLLPQLAQEILEKIPSPMPILLDGPMGVGKTTLVSEICRQLGVKEATSSPTFSLVNEYQTADGEIVYHFDFYRVESIEEAMDMGAEEYFDSEYFCLIEWPEIIQSLLPEHHALIKISQEENLRRYELSIK